ncbi:MAG: hypothetical protein ACOX2W_00220 [Desulfomonilia bacterium]
MRIFKWCQVVLIVALTLIPAILLGFDFPGYATYHGKVIDADTLKPIEGAIVYAIWIKCRPGIGSRSCGPGKVKEVLTDADGEWKITGPKGKDPGYIRSIIGYLVPWIEFPLIGYYKAGYYPYRSRYISGDFSAFAYVDETRNIEGIVLTRMGDTEEQVRQYMEQWEKDRCEILVPVKDPERKLRELDFDFRYPQNVKRVYIPDGLNMYEQYKVIGLNRAVTLRRSGRRGDWV